MAGIMSKINPLNLLKPQGSQPPPGLQTGTDPMNGVEVNLDQFKDQIVTQVNKEFKRRQRDRLPFELQWRINIEFVNGNQYVDIDPRGVKIVEIPKLNWYQEREVFNTIASIHETRLAQLSNTKPMMKVTAVSNDDEDVAAARVTSKVLQSTWKDQDMDSRYVKALAWMEQTGTCFLKPYWDKQKGRFIGSVQLPKMETEDVEKKEDDDETVIDPVEEMQEQQNPNAPEMETIDLYEGDIDTLVCTPFELYPDSCYRSDVQECQSLIHARAYHVDEIEEIWGVRVEAESSVDIMTLQPSNNIVGGLGYISGYFRAQNKTVKHHAIVKEYYERPSRKHPQGRLIVVANEELLHIGPLPYAIGNDGNPEFPFVRMVALEKLGCFFGQSVIERCIPVQRRYNAIRNRKAEYLNRVGIGQWMAEEDSLTDDSELNDEPGNIIYYKRGFGPPSQVPQANLPASFEEEIAQLQSEFSSISGVSQFSLYGIVPGGMRSGIALSLENEQNTSRISLTAENIADASIKLGKYWIRLYRQFAQEPRILKIMGQYSDVEVRDWEASDLNSDDVMIDNQTAIAETPAQRKQMVFDLIGTGIFNRPETNPFTDEGVRKILEMLEFGYWQGGIDDSRQIQIDSARKENYDIGEGSQVQVNDYDDHKLHIDQHNRYRMSDDYKQIANGPLGFYVEFLMKQHIQEHAQALYQNTMNQMGMTAPPGADPNQPSISAVTGQTPPLPSQAPTPQPQNAGAKKAASDQRNMQSQGNGKHLPYQRDHHNLNQSHLKK